MASLSLSVSSLRTYLLSSLAPLPGSRIFHLHVLASSARKPAQSLFPYASHRPKCLVQDILILLSEQGEFFSAEPALPSGSKLKQESIEKYTPHIFVSAIEASVYTFPASDSTILYISKVDGTGQGLFPSPTSTLLKAFLGFYASPQSPTYPMHITRHLWIHLFARSQRQYLFPNSADHPNKKPLGDIALCKWWKNILTDVAKVVMDAGIQDTNGPLAVAPVIAPRLYYILPGQSKIEASYLLREPQPSSSTHPIEWVYSHPYDNYAETGRPPPSGPHVKPPVEKHASLPLALLIPHFEDDPKSRFLDELSATSEEQAVAIPVPTPKRKRARADERDEPSFSTLTHHPDGHEHHGKSVTDDEKNQSGGVSVEASADSMQRPQLPAIVYNPPSSSPAPAGVRSPPSRPSTPEPAGEIPASLSPHIPKLPNFPTSLLSPHTPPPGPSRVVGTSQTPNLSGTPRTPQTPQTPRRPKTDLDTITPTEFWERMSFRQECAQGAVTGFFVASFSRPCDTGGGSGYPAHVPHSPLEPRSHASNPTDKTDIPHTLLVEGTVPHAVIKRVMSSLLTGVEFSTTERAQKGTEVIETAIKGLCEGLGDMNKGLTTKEHLSSDAEISIQGIETYKAHVYAPLVLSNPPLPRKPLGSAASDTSTPVNVLGVRRKKKRT